MLIRSKLVFLILAFGLLGTGCGDEVSPKDFTAEQGTPNDPCVDDGTGKYLCLATALQQIDPATQQPIDPVVECAKVPATEACGKYKFLNDGYGGFVYPQPVMNFFNGMYAHYVSYNHGISGALPSFRHFGEYFGLIYPDSEAKPTTPAEIDAALLPIGIVSGGTNASGNAYASESCALCHFSLANDGYYRFGIPATRLKYGGLKLAFNRFVCYAEAENEYAALATQCETAETIAALDDAGKAACATYQAFLSSTGNANLLGLWRDDAVFSADKRRELLDGIKNAVPGSANACAAVGQLLPPYSNDQIQQLAQWDGIRYSSTQITDADASRIDRFYHSVPTVDGTQRKIDDEVHAPVKIPVLGNLVTDAAAAAQNYTGQFLGSGIISSLPQYVRWHAALVGGDNSVAEVQDAALEPLMKFLVSLKLPAPAVSQTTLDSPAYNLGKALFEEPGRCVSCHDVSSTAGQPLVAFYSTVGTDGTYSYMLDKDYQHVAPVPNLTPNEASNAPLGFLKTPRLQGVWTGRAFLHNGMAFSLEHLFCLTGNLEQRAAKDSNGNLVHPAPFLEDGHQQTCAADLTDAQRRSIITYLLTL